MKVWSKASAKVIMALVFALVIVLGHCARVPMPVPVPAERDLVDEVAVFEEPEFRTFSTRCDFQTSNSSSTSSNSSTDASATLSTTTSNGTLTNTTRLATTIDTITECHADYLISEITQVSPHGSGECVRGTSYFIEGYAIKVRANCSATFTYRSVVNFFDVRAVNCTCENWTGTETYCDVGFPIREVRLLEQLSPAAQGCAEGHGFDVDWHSVVTFGGCRATFAVYL